ncbi:hypothetical protein ABEO75_18605 [Paenibacillus macerans]|uniref:hypothetical protein n=1 Tax=Paenibacillus macerans TaxID=44252 RepID=UPI002E1E0CFA|nr:hypothetical protein [Paenibacillus macerans]
MTNSDKARKLYADMNTSIKESLLMPHKIFVNGRVPKYLQYALGILVRQYAEHNFEDDWVPVTRETFSISRREREGWKDLQRIIDLLEENKVIETNEVGTDKYIRIVEDELFDLSSYQKLGL